MTTYACTLDEAASAERLPADRALARLLHEVERTPTGAVARAPLEPEARDLVDAFIANESACCGFFDLARRETGDHVELHVDAPDEEAPQALVDQLVHALRLGAEGLPVVGDG